MQAKSACAGNFQIYGLPAKAPPGGFIIAVKHLQRISCHKQVQMHIACLPQLDAFTPSFTQVNDALRFRSEVSIIREQHCLNPQCFQLE